MEQVQISPHWLHSLAHACFWHCQCPSSAKMSDCQWLRVLALAIQCLTGSCTTPPHPFIWTSSHGSPWIGILMKIQGDIKVLNVTHTKWCLESQRERKTERAEFHGLGLWLSSQNWGKKKILSWKRERESCLQSNNRDGIQVTGHQGPVSSTRISSWHPWDWHITIPLSDHLQQEITCNTHDGHQESHGHCSNYTESIDPRKETTLLARKKIPCRKFQLVSHTHVWWLHTPPTWALPLTKIYSLVQITISSKTKLQLRSSTPPITLETSDKNSFECKSQNRW